VSVAPRLTLLLGDDWNDTSLRLPAGTYTDVFTGATREGTVRIEDMLSDFPVALLEPERSAS
jgi:maltooligosyltrehalose synthase